MYLMRKREKRLPSRGAGTLVSPQRWFSGSFCQEQQSPGCRCHGTHLSAHRGHLDGWVAPLHTRGWPGSLEGLTLGLGETGGYSDGNRVPHRYDPP